VSGATRTSAAVVDAVRQAAAFAREHRGQIAAWAAEAGGESQ
jgi:hypothetical protein